MTQAGVQLEIVQSQPFAEGYCFEGGGCYERLLCCANFRLNPKEEEKRGVIDVGLAPVDEEGLIAFSTEFFVLRPMDASRANGACLLEFPNRGNKRCLQFFNDASFSNDPHSLAHAGHGFLMRKGYSVVCAAWQGDVLAGDGRLLCHVPVAQKPDGSPITGFVRSEFLCETRGTFCLPLSGSHATRSHPVFEGDKASARLQRRRYPHSAWQVMAPETWHFARLEGGGHQTGAGDISGGELAIIESDSHIYLPQGFEPGWIYQLVYHAYAPLVLDLGFVAMRELAAFLRHDMSEANPLYHDCSSPRRLYAWGRSQPGRAIRDFIYRGFNEDRQGRKVFDGMMTHVAGGGKTSMKRFSNLVVAASRQYEDWENPADNFPFSYAMSRDHVTGKVDGILKKPKTDPLVIHTQTASEYWYRRGSLVHTDTQGGDLAQPENVRIYFWASSQHWSPPLVNVPVQGAAYCHYQNVVQTSAFFRATLERLHEWSVAGKPPPPSQIPRRDDGSLQTMEEWRAGFPVLAGVALPREPNRLPLIDYGMATEQNDDLGADWSQEYIVQVPAVDRDGNDIAGVRAPMVAAPLGTYTGWNIRTHGHGAGALFDFSGSYIPFADTVEEREMTGDPRLSIMERYASTQAYQQAIKHSALKLVAQSFLLEEDVERAECAAEDWGRPRHHVHL